MHSIITGQTRLWLSYYERSAAIRLHPQVRNWNHATNIYIIFITENLITYSYSS